MTQSTILPVVRLFECVGRYSGVIVAAVLDNVTLVSEVLRVSQVVDGPKSTYTLRSPGFVSLFPNASSSTLVCTRLFHSVSWFRFTEHRCDSETMFCIVRSSHSRLFTGLLSDLSN
jgi:hypothetical protein